MRSVLGFAVAVVALAVPSIAFAQAATQPQPGTPVYREWMPAPTPIGGDPPATTPAKPGTGTSGTGTGAAGATGNGEAGSGSGAPGSSSTTTTVKVGEGGAAGAAGAAGAEGADKPGDGEAFEKEKEGRTRVFLDVMFGFGVTPVVNQTIVGPYVTSES